MKMNKITITVLIISFISCKREKKYYSYFHSEGNRLKSEYIKYDGIEPNSQFWEVKRNDGHVLEYGQFSSKLNKVGKWQYYGLDGKDRFVVDWVEFREDSLSLIIPSDWKRANSTEKITSYVIPNANKGIEEDKYFVLARTLKEGNESIVEYNKKVLKSAKQNSKKKHLWSGRMYQKNTMAFINLFYDEADSLFVCHSIIEGKTQFAEFFISNSLENKDKNMTIFIDMLKNTSIDNKPYFQLFGDSILIK